MTIFIRNKNVNGGYRNIFVSSIEFFAKAHLNKISDRCQGDKCRRRLSLTECGLIIISVWELSWNSFACLSLTCLYHTFPLHLLLLPLSFFKQWCVYMILQGLALPSLHSFFFYSAQLRRWTTKATAPLSRDALSTHCLRGRPQLRRRWLTAALSYQCLKGGVAIFHFQCFLLEHLFFFNFFVSLFCKNCLMDGLLARLKLGSKRKKKTSSSVKRSSRPESARQAPRDTTGSLYSNLTASSSTVSACSAPEIVVLKKEQVVLAVDHKDQVDEQKKKNEQVVKKPEKLEVEADGKYVFFRLLKIR